MQASAFWQGAGGTRVGFVVVVNRGKDACTLGGYPTVQIKDSRGKVLPIREHRTADAPVRLVRLRHGDKVAASIQWVNWCGTLKFPLHLWLNLRGQSEQLKGRITAVSGDPPCLAPLAASLLNVGPFEVPPYKLDA
jgi:hypothetical protein